MVQALDLIQPTTGLNAVGAFATGANVANEIAQTNLQQQKLQMEQNQMNYNIAQQQQQQQQQQALQQLSIEAFNNPQALKQVYAANPDLGASIAKERDKYNRVTSNVIDDTLSVPIEHRQKAFDLAKSRLQASGISTDDLPEKYSPEFEQVLKRKKTELATWDDTFKALETDRGLMLLGEKTGAITPTGFGVYNKPPSTLVNVDNKSEFQEQKDIGAINAERYKKTLDQGDNARQQIDTLSMMKQAVLDPNAAQGAFADIRSNAKKYSELLGFEVKGLTNEGIIDSLGNKLALQLRNPKGENGGLTGNTSDRDVKFLVAGVPSKGKTQSQNLALIDIGLRQSQRDREISALAQQYVDQNKTFKGFDKVRDDYLKTHPLYNTQEIKNLEAQLKPKSTIKTIKPIHELSDEELKSLQRSVR
jgi:hypothetical protein